MVVGLISGFINNTAAVGVFMPVAMQLARHYRFSPSKILLPLSYTAIFGGTITLLGTSTNLLVSSLSQQHGSPPFSVFEFLSLGSVFFAVGLIYNILVPMRLLPSRTILSSLTRGYHLSSFLTELKVAPNSRIIGSTVVDAHVSERYQINVLEIIRGKEKIPSDLRHTPLYRRGISCWFSEPWRISSDSRSRKDCYF